MAKRIDQVLSKRELTQILRIGYDIGDIHQVGLLENALHIVCENEGDDLSVLVYPSLRNPYERRILPEKTTKKPRRKDEDELYEKRRGHLVNNGRRHETLLDEIRIRNHDIEVHKHYLSETEGYDVGWLVASAHWLKGYGPEFYTLSKEQHQDLGMDFEWKGMEKSVGIVVNHTKRTKSYYAVVRSEDLFPEEHFAQACGGAMKVLDKERYDLDVDMAARLRPKIEELCGRYFCILGEK